MLPAMMILALLAAAAAQPAEPPKLAAATQARATVRIVRGERISAARIPPDAIVSETRVKSADGSQSPARLIEFP